jgi:hypothetical protein
MPSKIVKALSVSYRRDTTLQIRVKTAFGRMSTFSRASSCVHCTELYRNWLRADTKVVLLGFWGLKVI